MSAIIDKTKLPSWILDIDAEPEPNPEYEKKYKPLMVELARAVTEAAINNPDEFAFLIYCTTQIFQTGFGYMKETNSREIMGGEGASNLWRLTIDDRAGRGSELK